MRKNLYRYENITRLGLLIFLCVFTIYMLPITFVALIMVATSNVSLILKEGRNWKSMNKKYTKSPEW